MMTDFVENPAENAEIPDYFQGLNPEQARPVATLDGPVLVLAGAGTGKTRVLTTRLAHVIKSGRAWPNQILAVTFTNKAAQEMKHRIAALLDNPDNAEGMWLGTFHAIAARMLRRHAELVGLSSNFTILDDDDQVRLIKSLMEIANIDTKKTPPRALAAQIGRWKDKGLKPADIPPGEAGAAGGIYAQYQARLKTLNACDFGDLLLHMIEILRAPQHADILADYHRRFRYIMVDEYQDTNVAQYLWLRLLVSGSNNVCCVGDDDQSIYGWRGAEVENILRFERDFPGAAVIRLEQNYRSTGHILGAASGVIAQNEGRLGKTLWSQAEPGEKVAVQGVWDAEAEARFVAETIEQLQRKGFKLNDVAVLVRAGFQMREFEERFMQTGLNYRVIGGPRFYERAEIRDALAYLRVVAQPNDDLALERIINLPKRGIGDTTLQMLYTHARERGLSLYSAILSMLDHGGLKPKTHDTLKSLMTDFTRWRDALATMEHPQLAATVLEESGYMAMWQADKTPEAPGRIENLKELITGMAEFESLSGFLEHVSLVMEAQNKDGADDDAITIITLHGAKGLEFPVVFLPGWEEGLFPSQRSMDENGIKGLEEERRLAYVGITRARQRCFISYAANRRVYGNWTSAIPSRFVDELPGDHIDALAETGLYTAGKSQHWDSSGFSGMVRTAHVPSRPVERVSVAGFKSGDRVSHGSFGPGTVIHVDGNKLDILFDAGGQKRLMDSFVQKDG